MSAEKNEASEELVEHTYNGKTIMIYPELAEFHKAMDGAVREQHLAYAKADAAWQVTMNADKIKYLEEGGDPNQYEERSRNRTAYEAYVAARRAAEHKYYDLTEVGRMRPESRRDANNPNAWADLRAKTTHKEVQWILDNTLRSEPSATRTMLHYLPASPEKLWEYGKDDHNFCNAFDQFYAQAEAAGLFSKDDIAGMAGMKEFRALQSYMRRELYGSTATTINQKVAKIMAVMREEHAKAMAEAKAEWQGLDEARRSEGARKAAVTRAANREAQEHQREDGIVEVPQPHAAAQAASKAAEDVGCQICATQPDRVHRHDDPFAQELQERVNMAVRATVSA